MQPQTEVKPQPRTFYSSIGALVVNINNGQRVMEANGVSKIVGQKVVEFTPMPDNFGHLVTTDPEVIAAMESRIASGNTTIFDNAEYQRRTTPADVRLKMLQSEHDRLLADHNRLVAKLEADGKLPGQPKPKP